MTDEKITDLLMDFTKQISALNENFKNLMTKLVEHENRLHDLEQNKTGLKDNVIKWLIICLIVSCSSVASLVGAGSILKMIFGAM